MLYIDRYKRRQGMTLIELMCIVLLIGIMAGYTAVTIGAKTELAKTNTCLVNRKEILSAYTLYSMIVGEDNIVTVNEFIDDDELLHKYMNGHIHCPAEGEYTGAREREGRVTVNCSKHGSSGGLYSFSNMGTGAQMGERLLGLTAVNEFFRDHPGYGSNRSIDSAANHLDETMAMRANKELAELLGQSMDGKSWRVVNFGEGKKTVYMTDVDIKLLNPGDKITVIKYEQNGKKLTTQETTVGQKTEAGVTYNVINHIDATGRIAEAY